MTKTTTAPLAPVPGAAPDDAVEVTRVEGALEKDRFIRFQWEIYDGDLHWVPPLLMERREFLDAEKNPFYQHAEVALFLARRGGKVVGRIAAMEDRNFNAYHGTRTAYFGLFESVNDPGVAAALFKAAKDWARWRGLDTLLGPLNLSTNHEVGLLVEGFDSAPYFLMAYNPHWYADLFKACGLEKAKDLYAWERSARTPPPERFVRLADKIREHDEITVRSADLKDFAAEAGRIKEIYDGAWDKTWGFLPMTTAEFAKLAKDLRQMLVPDLALIAEHRGEPIAFSFAVPDFNQALQHVNGRLTSFGLPLGLAKLMWHARRIDRLRHITLAVKPGWRRRGVDALLIVEAIRRAKALGYAGGEVSWTLQDNEPMIRAIEASGCTRTKTYRVYQVPTT
ncbi:MAG TPA: N-acetyltransferase [Anaeromyxobacteraceae bacterium]|nr:N-acetyltransferase [Anaeromyxobacteraceae bacterium]